jgi:DNA repair exonuclease SbcCD ATPase subunit
MKKIWILALVLAVTIGACKKSVSGQTSQWTHNLAELDEAITQYPALKELLTAKATEAKAIFAESEKISDETQKAEKIAAAIDKLKENLGVVLEIKYKLKGVDSTIEKVTKVKTTKDRANRATSEIKAIRSEQDAIEKALSALKPKTSEELKAQCKELVSKIISLSGRADRVLKLVKGK